MKIEGVVGFIGTGNMAEALIRGLLHAEVATKEQILGSDPREERRAEMAERYGVRTVRDNVEVARQAEILVLSVKPQVMAKVLAEIGPHIHPHALVISIAAGIPLAAIEAQAAPGAGDPHDAEHARRSSARARPRSPPAATRPRPTCWRRARIFDSVGTTVVLEEAQMDAVTGLSGSGPAYIFLIIEALSDAGVKVGLSRYTAQALAAQTVLGSAKLLIETKEHPGRLKDMVTSPGGTAIAGLHTLEAGGLRTTLMDAVEVATQRSRELGEMATAALARS